MVFRYNILLIFVSDLMSCIFLGIYSNYFHEGFMIVFPNWFNLHLIYCLQTILVGFGF